MHRISSRGKRRSCKFASNLVQLAVSFLLLFYLYSLILSSQKFENVFPIGILTFARILNDSETRKTADRQRERSRLKEKMKQLTPVPSPFNSTFCLPFPQTNLVVVRVDRIIIQTFSIVLIDTMYPSSIDICAL